LIAFLTHIAIAGIAAIAAAHGFAVATRDEAASKAMDARVINPWTA
jgi:predicted nucleic acid-binding protein